MTTSNTTTKTEDTVAKAAGVAPDSHLATLLQGRADIFALTQITQDAALNPQTAGGISPTERVALACRIAQLNNVSELAAQYQQTYPQIVSVDAALFQRLADPAQTSTDFDDVRLAALIRHVDLVTQTPKDASRADIQALRDAGLTEADIVRLSEIIAFVNYQLRLVAGLQLLGARA